MARQSRRGALARYVRGYHLAPRYAPGARFALMAADGVRLAAHRIDGPRDAPCTVVLVHGLAHWSRTPRIHGFARLLSARVNVIVPDLRGHGRSEGESSFGRSEHLDVEAAVACAGPSLPVVTVGVSLGGAAVLLHAARCGGVREVVAVSPPATWGGLDTQGARLIEKWVRRPAGRRAMAVVLRTRLSADCDDVADAADEVAAIRDASTLIVADPEDWYFGPEHAERLYAIAPEPKELWWVRDGGHGSDLLTRAFAARLLARWC